MITNNGKISNLKSAIAKIWLINVKVDLFKVQRLSSDSNESIDKRAFSRLEFDIWYNECYVNGTNTVDELQSSIKVNQEFQFYDDAAERFERMQKDLLLSNAESMPFRQAQMRTNRRVRHRRQ
jgi:hypothetical protein